MKVHSFTQSEITNNAELNPLTVMSPGKGHTCQFNSGNWNIGYFLWYLHVLNYSYGENHMLLETVLSPPGWFKTSLIEPFMVFTLPLKNPTSYLKNTNVVSLAFWNTMSFCLRGYFQRPLERALLHILAGWPPGHAAKISEVPSVEPLALNLYLMGKCIPRQSIHEGRGIH